MGGGGGGGGGAGRGVRARGTDILPYTSPSLSPPSRPALLHPSCLPLPRPPSRSPPPLALPPTRLLLPPSSFLAAAAATQACTHPLVRGLGRCDTLVLRTDLYHVLHITTHPSFFSAELELVAVPGGHSKHSLLRQPLQCARGVRCSGALPRNESPPSASGFGVQGYPILSVTVHARQHCERFPLVIIMAAKMGRWGRSVRRKFFKDFESTRAAAQTER